MLADDVVRPLSTRFCIPAAVEFPREGRRSRTERLNEFLKGLVGRSRDVSFGASVSALMHDGSEEANTTLTRAYKHCQYSKRVEFC